MGDEQLIVPPERLHEFTTRLATKVGTTLSHAHDLADLIVAADHRGHYSHGMNRLDFYLIDLHNRHTAVDKEPQVIKNTPATALVDGNNCLGPAVGKFCIDLAIEMAKSVGIGWVCANRSNHFGIAGWYSMRAAEQGLIGMAFCNSSPNMIPTRGKMRTLGTNPISVAAKTNDGDKFVLDMATTAVAQGKVEMKERLGQPTPVGWAVDREGQPCTDPTEILHHGGLNPLGGSEETSGYKGYGLGMMVELFCGILSGSRFGTNVRSWDCHTAEGNLGQCFVAIDPSVFAPGFDGRLTELMAQCRGGEPAGGQQEVLVPGDPEQQHVDKCTKLGGIPYYRQQIDYADEIAVKYGVEPLVRLQQQK